MRRSFYFSAACGSALVVFGTSVPSAPLQHYERYAGDHTHRSHCKSDVTLRIIGQARSTR